MAFRRCNRGKCGHNLGTCNIADQSRHVRHRTWARCNPERDGRVDRSCSSCHHRRRHRHRLRIGFRHSEARCNHERDGLVGRSCSSCHHRLHRHGLRLLAGILSRYVPPRCNCSKSLSGHHRHRRRDAAGCNPERCVPVHRSCSRNGLP